MSRRAQSCRVATTFWNSQAKIYSWRHWKKVKKKKGKSEDTHVFVFKVMGVLTFAVR